MDLHDATKREFEEILADFYDITEHGYVNHQVFPYSLRGYDNSTSTMKSMITVNFIVLPNTPLRIRCEVKQVSYA